MADRFPSIEDIDAGQHETLGGPVEGSFLDRERAILGEDAEQFGAIQDHTNNAATVEDDDGDLLGGDYVGGDNRTTMIGGDMDDFESSFPAIDTQNEVSRHYFKTQTVTKSEALATWIPSSSLLHSIQAPQSIQSANASSILQKVGPGGSITNTSAPYQTSGYTNYTAPSEEQDTEPIRQWREKRDAVLARRDEISAKKKEETIATARTDIDSFYESYNRKTDKQKAQTAKEAEEFLKNREDTTAGGTAWERIAKLTDLSGKGQIGGGEGSTKKRMRDMLLSLKGDKDAPGASGV